MPKLVYTIILVPLGSSKEISAIQPVCHRLIEKYNNHVEERMEE